MGVLTALPHNVPLAREIFLVGGQSNGDGRGFLSELPSTGFPLQFRVKQFKNDMRWYPAADPLDDQADNIFKDAFENQGVGPYVAMGAALARLRPNKEIGLSQGALGGTSLASWTPSADLGSLYGLTVYKARRALEEGGTIRGFCFHQGESDATTSASIANAWATNFLEIVAALRSDLGLPNLPVVYAVINTNPASGSFPYWDNVVASQMSIDLKGRNMARVLTADLPFRTDVDVQKVHLATAGQIILGQRFAAALQPLLTA